MKVVILLAGVGKRLGEITKNNHKSLIKLDDFSLLHHLIENFISFGYKDFLPIVGHCSEKIIDCLNSEFSQNIDTKTIYNKYYDSRNNLYSLYCAREELDGKEFILCNGDLIFDRNILNNLTKMEGLSAIAIDDRNYSNPIDSPGVKLSKGKVIDLGRHISFSENNGYAIGIYKFNKALSNAFFKSAKNMLDLDLNAGFHDPLIELFEKMPIYKSSTDEFLWTDIDNQEDIKIARTINKEIMSHGY